MKIKHLVTAGAMILASAVSLLAVSQPTYAADNFNPDDEKNGCPHGSLYWSYHYKASTTKNADGKTTTTWGPNSNPTGPEPKAATDIKNINDCNLAKTDFDAMKTANTIINVIVGLVGFVAVAVIVIGGITFATSQGDPGKTAKAKNTILFGVVGLVVSLLAFAIVNFVLKSVFSD